MCGEYDISYYTTQLEGILYELDNKKVKDLNSLRISLSEMMKELVDYEIESYYDLNSIRHCFTLYGFILNYLFIRSGGDKNDRKYYV